MSEQKHKIYIAGKIGSAGVVAMRHLFDEAALLLYEGGWEPVNPCDIKGGDSWESCMVADVHALLDCEAIYVLSNWKSSPGATIEVQLAMRLKKTVIHQGDYEGA